MNEHTPGPWTFDTDDLGTWINSETFPEPIAKMGTSKNLPTQANARLIAAAPELYEVLMQQVLNGNLNPIPIEVRQLLNRLDDDD